jgi:ribosomal protein S18 acetylase RimI-like enzyme
MRAIDVGRGLEAMTEKIRVRPACQEDREQVLAFCGRTFEWGDYIGDVWDRWLNDPAGPLLVAIVGDQVVGTGKVTMISGSEAWLEGLRVNPAFRGHGLAQAMYEAAETTARKRWARVARYATFSNNTAIHHLSERFGYRRVARFIEYAAAAEVGQSPEPLRLEDAGAAEVLLAAMAGLAASGGLYAGGWHVQELRGGRLREHIVNGEAYALYRENRPIALALISGREHGQILRLGFLGGNTSAVTELARQIRALARTESLAQVQVVLPALEAIVEAVRVAGYEPSWDQEVWIYERRLKG